MSEERRKVLVDEANLRQVLQALNGPSHYIRELQITRGSLFANPIDALVEEFNAAMEALNGATPKDEQEALARSNGQAQGQAEG